MTVPRAAAWFIASLLCNLLGARLLNTLGLLEGLLSPSGWRLLLLVPLAVSFYCARFVAYFVAPGLLLGTLVVWLSRAALTIRRPSDGRALAHPARLPRK